MVQTLPAGILAAVKLIDEPVVAGVPPQLFTMFGVLAILTPEGKLSVNAAFVKTLAVGLIKDMVNADRPLGAIAAGENDLLMLGPCNTVSVAVACAGFDPALAVLTPPAGTIFIKVPAVAAKTLALTVQLPLAPTDPPDKPIVIPPGVASAVPAPQVVLTFDGLAITKPAGNVSDSANTVKPTVFALVTVMVASDVAPALILTGKKVLLATGGVKGVLTADTLIGAAIPAPSGSIAAVLVMMAGGLLLTVT